MKITKKIPGGKLLTLEYEVEDDKITKFRITGDFFAHPEWCIEEIEKELVGVEISKVGELIKNKMRTNGYEIIGFTPDDLNRLVNI